MYIRMDSAMLAADIPGTQAYARELFVIGRPGNGPSHLGCDAGGNNFCAANTPTMRLSYSWSQIVWSTCIASTTGFTPLAGSWYPITAGVDDSGNAQFWVSGLLIGSFFNGAFSPVANYFTFGLSNGGSEPFYIDEFRFYSVWDNTLHNGWSSGTFSQTGLEYYFDFSSDGTKFLDRSGKARDVLTSTTFQQVKTSPQCQPYGNGTITQRCEQAPWRHVCPILRL
jgi:hypothetical protein